MQSFDIYFLGEMLPDADPEKVRRGVARLFKIQESAVDRLFSGKPVRVKQEVDADTASRYRAAFRDIGALVQILPSGSPTPAAKPAPTPAAPDLPRDGVTAGAGQTRAPSDRHQADPVPAAAITADLAEPGAILDHRAPPAPAEIDTSALEALPPNSGTLEDCRADKPPQPIPDISHLRLVDD